MNALQRLGRSLLAWRKRPAARGAAGRPDVGFVACIERGALEAQALLLFESIRRFGGRFSGCEIYALSPRAGYEISAGARDRLEELGVRYIDAVINTECTEYGSANRVAAAAYVEEHFPHETLVILDSDTLFLREPEEFLLADDVDVALRPVDVKGMCSSGPEDPFDAYWRQLCELCGVEYECIPWIDSLVDRRRIKASYNGGLVVARGGLGIMRKWSAFFFASVREGLRPHADNGTFRAGAGWVEPATSRFWGSNQAALSVAVWSTTRRVRELPLTYNYPLHLHEKIAPERVVGAFPQLAHVHYHWLFEAEPLAGMPLWREDGPLSEEQRTWLRSRTPLD